MFILNKCLGIKLFMKIKTRPTAMKDEAIWVVSILMCKSSFENRQRYTALTNRTILIYAWQEIRIIVFLLFMDI